MISLILPVHNEYRNMKANFLKIYSALGKIGRFEIIIAEDGSTDGTVELAKGYSNMKNVVLLSDRNRIGKGGAIKKGVAAARGNVIGFMDIDLSVPLRYLKPAVDKVNEGNVFVIGNRYSKESNSKRRIKRFAESVSYNFLLRILFNSKVRDHQCGFKFWSAKFIKKEARCVKDDHWFFDSELIIRSQRDGIAPYEMRVDWKEGKTSNISSADLSYFFKAMLKFRLGS